MEMKGRLVALYGRFSPGLRDEFAAAVAERGGRVTRDLTTRVDFLVVGGLAHSLIASGALPARLELARRDAKAILGEEAFRGALADDQIPDPPTLSLDTALAQSGANGADATLLSAFGLIILQDRKVRFGDVATLKVAAALRSAGSTQTDMVRALVEARRSAPIGRHKVVLTSNGEPALQWEDGLTTLRGQGILPLDLAGSNVDDLFEAAVIAESEDRLDDALRLYDTCTKIDRGDAIAVYNFGNILLRRESFLSASMAYQRALARDPDFVEARYNLALAFEGLGRDAAAEAELRTVLDADPLHGDALYNLGQLLLGLSRFGEAQALFEQYLNLDPPGEWVSKARRAVQFCQSHPRS